jgi:dipeptidyl aminopeptidase/acylaminoacyl peptidase
VVNLLDDDSADGELDDIAADPVSASPLAARFAGTTVHYQGTDVSAQRHIDAIERRYPSRALLLQPGVSRWLVTERGGALQGPRFHLYDPASGHFNEVLADPPRDARGDGQARWLPESAMARQLPFSWTASDGMRLHGFVRVPPGVDPGQVPLVAVIHGGPWANVAAEEFGSGYAQFLVNRGYAVFEPNFRGSTGFGRDYMLAAAGDFGNGRVQADIVEGVRAVLAEGVGDSARVGVVGASFGGYATLLALTWQPDLFRVGVALVPPPDFAWDLTWIARSREAEVLSRKLPFERWMSLMDMDIADKAHMDSLHAQSPLVNAARMTRPLTIVAGGQDQRVALRGVLGYAATMKRLGKDVTLIVDPVAGHANESAVATEAVMYLLGDTLHRSLGGDAETPPDPPLRDYLMRNLRLGGRGLTTAATASLPASRKVDP